MKPLGTRRIVPVSAITIVAFSVLGVFELIVISGGLQLKASTVKKVAPWFHGTFIRLVGEHPDTRPEWSVAKRQAEEVTAKPDSASAMATVAGFSPGELSVEIEGADKPPEQPVMEPTQQQEEPSPGDPDKVPNTTPAEVVDDDEPVG